MCTLFVVVCVLYVMRQGIALQIWIATPPPPSPAASLFLNTNRRPSPPPPPPPPPVTKGGRKLLSRNKGEHRNSSSFFSSLLFLARQFFSPFSFPACRHHKQWIIAPSPFNYKILIWPRLGRRFFLSLLRRKKSISAQYRHELWSVFWGKF